MRTFFKKEKKEKTNQLVRQTSSAGEISDELELATQISLGIIDAHSPPDALDRVAHILQVKLPFDQMSVFLRRDDGMLEPAFAKSSKSLSPSSETDKSWGDTMARKAVNGRKTVVHENSTDQEKSDLRQTLSIPLQHGDLMTGALVLIRYQGPEFREDEIKLANFLGSQVLQIINQQKLTDQLSDLEARKHLTILQDEFIALISHELLTPLGFIKGYATTLLREDVTWDGSTQREFLSIIDEESDRLRQIIEDLLDSSRLQAGTLEMNFQPIKLDSFLKDISLRARTNDERLDLSMVIESPGIRIMGDSTRLAQVLDNLFSNAAKYAPNTPVKIILGRSGKDARIHFSDQGPGIPLESIDGLFNRFYRVPAYSKSVRGSGLGLFICRHIVEAHKGTIQVEPPTGDGAVFTITLPVIDTSEG